MPVKLTIVKIDNPKQNFKGSLTTYATFQTVTADGKPIPVAVTHGMLQRNSINPMFLKPLVGSELIVDDNNYEDPRTKLKTFTSAEQRVSDVINKVPNRSIILLNPTNGSIETSENFDSVVMEMATTVTAKVQVEENKAEKLQRQLRATENLRASLGLQIASPVAETVATAPAELEVNEDEIPF
jgi:hypothetical protein